MYFGGRVVLASCTWHNYLEIHPHSFKISHTHLCYSKCHAQIRANITWEFNYAEIMGPAQTY